MDFLLFIAGALATWRLSKLITEEEGPFGVVHWLRNQLPFNTWLGRGIRCLWCVSFWLGPIIGVAMMWDMWDKGVVYGLSWSALAIAFDKRVIERPYGK